MRFFELTLKVFLLSERVARAKHLLDKEVEIRVCWVDVMISRCQNTKGLDLFESFEIVSKINLPGSSGLRYVIILLTINYIRNRSWYLRQLEAENIQKILKVPFETKRKYIIVHFCHKTKFQFIGIYNK